MPATIAMALDLRGVTVTLTVARAAVAMAGLGAREPIEVRTSDPDSVRDLTVWARATGNRLVEQSQGAGWHRFVLQTRGPRPWRRPTPSEATRRPGAGDGMAG
ncbi:MAG TPA: sulfurtransferase TusA family protein [Streptosporangiaceae bacterium]|jgi:TusA-related sulfurtransferase|nr:sulfurtransferase TusA family protein [Actinomycetota bacterium]